MTSSYSIACIGAVPTLSYLSCLLQVLVGSENYVSFYVPPASAKWECIYMSNMQNIDLSLFCICKTGLHIFRHIFCIFCILFCIFFVIFCILIAYLFSYSAYYFEYLLSYSIFCIFFCIFIDIFCIYMSNMQNTDLSVFCILFTYFIAYSAYYFAYFAYHFAYFAYFN